MMNELDVVVQGYYSKSVCCSELRSVGVAAGPIGKGGVRKGYEKKLIEALVVEGDTDKMKRIIDGGRTMGFYCVFVVKNTWRKQISTLGCCTGL